MLFGHVVGFVSQSALPQKHQDLKWVLASYVLSIWGSNARMEATFWAQIGAKFGHLGPCSGIWRLQLCFWGQSWGILSASWAIGRSCSSPVGVPFCCFCVQQCSPCSRTKILNGFLRAIFAPFGVKVPLPYGPVGAIFGPTSTILGSTSAILGLC